MRIYFLLVDKKLQLLFTFLICSTFFSYFQVFSSTFGRLTAFEFQPILQIFICILIYIYYLKKRLGFFPFIDGLYSISSVHFSLCCLLVVILLVFIIDTIFNGWGNRFFILFELLLGPLIYLLISTSKISFHKQFLKLFVFSLFLISMILHFEISFFYTPLYNFLNEHVLRYIRYLPSSERGISLFSSEPSFAAIQLILLYIVVDISFIELKEKLLLLSFILIMLLWNKSATGYSLLLLYYFPYIFQKKFILKNIFGLVCFSVILLLGPNNRFIEVLLNIKNALFIGSQGIDYGIIGNILSYEISEGVRISCFLLGIIYIFLYPFGNGLAEKIPIELLDKFSILPWEKIFSQTSFVNSSHNTQAYIQVLSLSVGIFSLLLCVFVFYCYYYSSISSIYRKIGILLIIFSLFFFHISIGPITWIFCAILHRFQEVHCMKVKL